MAGQKVNSVLFICLGMYDAVFCAVSLNFGSFCLIIDN